MKLSSKFLVRIRRDGFNVGCRPWGNNRTEEYFKHDELRIWGIVEAGNSEAAIDKLIDHAYENDLWYSIGGKSHGRT